MSTIISSTALDALLSLPSTPGIQLVPLKQAFPEFWGEVKNHLSYHTQFPKFGGNENDLSQALGSMDFNQVSKHCENLEDMDFIHTMKKNDAVEGDKSFPYDVTYTMTLTIFISRFQRLPNFKEYGDFWLEVNAETMDWNCKVNSGIIRGSFVVSPTQKILEQHPELTIDEAASQVREGAIRRAKIACGGLLRDFYTLASLRRHLNILVGGEPFWVGWHPMLDQGGKIDALVFRPKWQKMGLCAVAVYLDSKYSAENIQRKRAQARSSLWQQLHNVVEIPVPCEGQRDRLYLPDDYTLIRLRLILNGNNKIAQETGAKYTYRNTVLYGE